MTKDWKDCPFGTVFTYSWGDDYKTIRMGGVDLFWKGENQIYRTMGMGWDIEGPQANLRWMIPKEYLL